MTKRTVKFVIEAEDKDTIEQIIADMTSEIEYDGGTVISVV